MTNSNKFWIFFSVVALGLFILLAIAAGQVPYFAFDPAITRAIQSLRSPWLDVIMDLAGEPGLPPQAIVINTLFVLILWYCRMKAEAVTLLVALVVTGPLTMVIRYVLDRPRPDPHMVYVLRELENLHYGFPSGHVVNAIVALGFMMYVGWICLKPSWRRSLLLWLYGLYLALLAVSRFYVGEHWPSHVLGGVLLGCFFLSWEIVLYHWVKARFFQEAAPARAHSTRSSPN